MSRIGTIVKALYTEEWNDSSRREAPERKRLSKLKEKTAAFGEWLTSHRTLASIGRIVLVLFVLGSVAAAIFQYNRFAGWHITALARRADCGRELQRRSNLIPNLVSTVERYANYERGVFKYVSDARDVLQSAQTSTPPQELKTSGALQSALSRLVALAEQYPNLKTTQSIQDLIRELTNTENRIAASKAEYNHAVEIYNSYLTIFPGNMFARIFRFRRLPFMGLEGERLKVPEVNLRISGQGGE